MKAQRGPESYLHIDLPVVHRASYNPCLLVDYASLCQASDLKAHVVAVLYEERVWKMLGAHVVEEASCQAVALSAPERLPLLPMANRFPKDGSALPSIGLQRPL